MASKTVSEAKVAFIREQVRVLSTPLEPSPDWREYGPLVEDDISDKIVTEVLQKLNTLLKQHGRTVFSTQAIHHVSQQIERLYWNSISAELGDESAQHLVIDKGTDLTNARNIARLPDEWAEDGIGEESKGRYDTLRGRLIELAAEQRKREERLLQYKRLKAMLEPFEDPLNTIQPNLVTRDGQLGVELDRMRMLLAKVSAKVGRRQGPDARSEKGAEPDSGEKIARLLDMT